jgi:hypothetical protein
VFAAMGYAVAHREGELPINSPLPEDLGCIR